MKNGLIYLLVGGVVGYLGYSFYLKNKKKSDKSKNVGAISKNAGEVLIIKDLPENTENKPIFNPKMVKDYQVAGSPAQPHLVIYTSVAPPKPQLKTSDFVVDKVQPEVNYAWLL